jgi:hypothetical protein
MKTTANSFWQAWYNIMPGQNPSLHVVGEIDFGNESDSATIVFDSLLKKNPPILVLRVIQQTIFVPRPKGDTKVTLHYQGQFLAGSLGNIIIVLPDNQTVEIKAEEIGIAS